MNPKELVPRLVSLDLAGGVSICDIEMVSEADRGAVWLRFVVKQESQEFAKVLLNQMFPIQPGTVVITANDVVFVSEDGFPLQRVDADGAPPSSLLARAAIPTHVREWLKPRHGLPPRFLVRLPRSNMVMDAHELHSAIMSNTWYGCRVLPKSLANAHLNLRVGAQRVVTQPDSSGVGRLIVWERGSDLFGAFICEQARRSIPVTLWSDDGGVHRGELSIGELSSAVGLSAEDYSGFTIETELEIECFGGNGREWQEVGKDLLMGVRGNPAVRSTLRAILCTARDAAFRKKNAALENRRDELKWRKRVYVTVPGGERVDVGYEPQCEIELIILATRLEQTLDRVLGEFRILEHTSREGIDAVVKIRLAPDSPSQLAFAEFEYKLANFFNHQHPIRQVACVICWSANELTDQALAAARGWVIEKHQDGWSLLLRASDHFVRVFPLCRLPGCGLTE